MVSLKPGSMVRYLLFRFLYRNKSIFKKEKIKGLQHSTNEKKLKVLLIDDDLPADYLGAGFPRTIKLIEGLNSLNCHVTIFPTLRPAFYGKRAHKLENLGCSIIYPNQFGIFFSFNLFIKTSGKYFDLIIISRPHNINALKWNLIKHCQNVPVVYDAEALFIQRYLSYLKNVTHHKISTKQEKKLIDNELRNLNIAETIVAVSEHEASIFRKKMNKCVIILKHQVATLPLEDDYNQRAGILFVGSIKKKMCPNKDALQYFCREILPLLKNQGYDDKIIVVGRNEVKRFKEEFSKEIIFHGIVESVDVYYKQCKVFIAPTRFSAGIPLKVIEASAAGVPSVVTPLLAEQLGWKDNVDLLVADNQKSFAMCCMNLLTDCQLWTKIRVNAYNRIVEEYSKDKFISGIKEIVKPYGC
jgi:glycosyltransferase involved in cell wall biosynthesis